MKEMKVGIVGKMQVIRNKETPILQLVLYVIVRIYNSY